MIRTLSKCAAVVGLLAFPAAAVAAPESPPPGLCHVGAYALADGRKLVVQPSNAPNLRWRMLDGTTGKVFPSGDAGSYAGGDGWSAKAPVTTTVDFGSCGSPTIQFNNTPGDRIALPTTPITFASGPLSLQGELVMPSSGKPRAVVVLQYGSDKESAVWHNYVQYLLPLKDIAVFVFDKRGTGRSTGEYTIHFGDLADDMAAAIGAVRARPELKGVPLGLMGESQGGWVAPLAATKAKVDFVVVGYGLAVSLVEEDRSEVEQGLRAKGYGADVLAKGRAMHDAATRVAVSRFNEGADELARLKAASEGEPWRKGLGGDYTGPLSSMPAEDVKRIFSFGYDLAYEPVPTLEKLNVPMLWVLAGMDTAAPHERTLAILRALQAKGAPIDVVVFPKAEHGIIETDGAGKRLGRTAPGYFELLGDWMKTRRLEKAYGEGVEHRRR
ncbi:alpha/beta hydrolase family protein [Caulobacter mirabilis]|uniref:Alpha/beta hydrolase n=1 Tax=Caulobacter mirabilis TaxID=69666 RepID=A0A2D2AUN4_9CAUL|nr:alpha/beta hydrolase [Caulobacter mirabilis]ATQ41732.1 alpha/beta hydrolase [Caulobacter mirabilis]